MAYIPYGRQDINQADIQAVVDILQSDWITQGPTIEKFEQTVATYCGAKYAVAVNSATSALHIACLAADLGKGDSLWTTPNTFVASANCGLYCGANVDFVDIDKRSYNMSPAELEANLVRAKHEGKVPKVVIPVHFAGQSCEMDKIANMAREYKFTIIEDASHAIGGNYQGKKIGACQYSDMTVFSFHPVKIITTAEGGMVLTNNSDLYEKLIRLRSHGITRNPEFMQGQSDGPWYYQQIELGYNYRMTDLQAALGISQMNRIDEFVKRRHTLAARYNEKLSGSPIITPWQNPDCYSAWHLYVIQVDPQQRRRIFEELRRHDIGVNVHYIPVHTQAYYQRLGFSQGDFPEAEKYYQAAISLPMYYTLTDEQQDFVIDTVKKVLA